MCPVNSICAFSFSFFWNDHPVIKTHRDQTRLVVRSLAGRPFPAGNPVGNVQVRRDQSAKKTVRQTAFYDGEEPGLNVAELQRAETAPRKGHVTWRQQVGNSLRHSLGGAAGKPACKCVCVFPNFLQSWLTFEAMQFSPHISSDRVKITPRP